MSGNESVNSLLDDDDDNDVAHGIQFTTLMEFNINQSISAVVVCGD